MPQAVNNRGNVILPQIFAPNQWTYNENDQASHRYFVAMIMMVIRFLHQKKKNLFHSQLYTTFPPLLLLQKKSYNIPIDLNVFVIFTLAIYA